MSNQHNLLKNLAIAAILTFAAAPAFANGPTKLSNQQLDRVSAGGAVVTSNTGAFATGALALTEATTHTVVGGSTPIQNQPGLATVIGVSDGTATAVGANLGVSGPSPTSGTSVNTAGAADGTTMLNFTTNQTLQGAGGVVFQAGWTVVYGSYTGL